MRRVHLAFRPSRPGSGTLPTPANPADQARNHENTDGGQRSGNRIDPKMTRQLGRRRHGTYGWSFGGIPSRRHRSAFGMDEQTMGVHTVGRAGHERHQIAALLRSEAIHLTRQYDFGGIDLIGMILYAISQVKTFKF